MIKEANGFGSTIEEAIEDAKIKLGASETDDVKVDVIKMPKKKTLGLFGGNDAEVKAYIEIADKQVKKSATEKKPQVKKEKSAKEKPVKEKPAKEKPVKEPKPEKIQVEEKPEIVYGEPVDESQVDSESPAGKAIKYIRNILEGVNCNGISIKVANAENASMLTLDGEDISIIIGRRGETLDALQYLSSLAANNGGGHYKITVNVGNYREKRAETLIELANKVSEQVLKTGKNRTLEPMNPYERRIIHTAVQGIDGVESKSFGEGIDRRIVISVEGSEVRPPRFSDRRRQQRRPARKNSGRRTNEVASPTREPKNDADVPLYGKIN